METVLQDRLLKVLDLSERAVRGMDVDFEDEESDGPELHRAFRALAADLAVLQRAAGAQWTAPFRSMFSRAHSIRCVDVDRSTKQSKRQRLFKCDGCGKYETGCRYAVDVVGHKHFSPLDWLQRPSWLPEMWSEFEEMYDEALNADSFGSHDLGRVYLGKTCLRKAKLQFQANVFVLEMLYNAARHMEEVRSNGQERNDVFYTALPEEARRLERYYKNIQFSVASAQHAAPQLLTDATLWKSISACRDATAEELNVDVDQMLRRRTQDSLKQASVDDKNDSEDEEVVYCEDEEEEEDEEEWCEQDEECECEDVSAPAAAQRSNKQGEGGARRKRGVFEESDSDEEAQPAGTQAQGGQISRNGKRRSIVVEEDDEDQQDVPQQQDDKGGAMHASGSGGETVARLKRGASTSAKRSGAENVPAPAPAPAPARRASRRVRRMPPEGEAELPDAPCTTQATTTQATHRAPDVRSATSVAQEMRIPRDAPTGAAAAPRLGSRRAVLRDLMDLKQQCFLQRRDDDAARLSRVEVTMLELLQMAERREQATA